MRTWVVMVTRCFFHFQHRLNDFHLLDIPRCPQYSIQEGHSLQLHAWKFLSPYIVWLKVFESLYCMVESYWVFVLFARKFFGCLYCMDESCLVLVLHVWKFLCPNNVCLKVFEPLYCMPEVVKTAFWIQNDNSMIIICSFSCMINPWGWHAFFKVNDLS